MLPPWPLPLRHGHSCMYTRSVFERKKMNCDTVVIHACTRELSTLQRLQMCSRATIASFTWNKYQLIDNFYSLLAASICCHRGRYRCDTAIHACTRGLCYEPLERFIGILEPRQNNGDNSAIIPLEIRNGVILTQKGVSTPHQALLDHFFSRPTATAT